MDPRLVAVAALLAAGATLLPAASAHAGVHTVHAGPVEVGAWIAKPGSIAPVAVLGPGEQGEILVRAFADEPGRYAVVLQDFRGADFTQYDSVEIAASGRDARAVALPFRVPDDAGEGVRMLSLTAVAREGAREVARAALLVELLVEASSPGAALGAAVAILAAAAARRREP